MVVIDGGARYAFNISSIARDGVQRAGGGVNVTLGDTAENDVIAVGDAEEPRRFGVVVQRFDDPPPSDHLGRSESHTTRTVVSCFYEKNTIGKF